jgi:serine protease
LAAQAQRRSLDIQDVGLPAMNVGLVRDASHAPGTPHTRANAIVDAAIRNDGRVHASGSAATSHVIVRFREEASPGARAAAVRAAVSGGAIMDRPSYADFDLVRIGDVNDPEAVVAALKTRHADVVENAQAAYRWRTLLTPNDPLYVSTQWNLPYMNLEPAWDIQPAAGSDITVAVLDSGVAYRNATITVNIPGFTVGSLVYPPLGVVTIPYAAASQLVNASNQTRIVSPYDFIWDSNTPLDFEGHGTHVSGTLGQITNDNTGPAGVAFNVKLMPIKVLDGVWDFLFGSPYFATDDIVARAIRYAADRGAKVLNMSIGRSGPPSFVIEDAIRYAVGRGAFVAVAAGNEYLEGNPISVLAEICSRVNGAISVAAIDRNRGHASYSTAGAYVEISAPGGDGSTPGFSGIDTFIVQQTFDFRFTDTYLLPPSQYTAPRFDVQATSGMRERRWRRRTSPGPPRY